MKQKIRWKRILIAAIWSELLLFLLYVPTQKYTGSPSFFVVLAMFEMLIPLFLGGLWIVRKTEPDSYFMECW